MEQEEAQVKKPPEKKRRSKNLPRLPSVEEHDETRKPTTKLAHIASPPQQAYEGGGRGRFSNKAVQQDDQVPLPALFVTDMYLHLITSMGSIWT
jgi:hypothetical protein